MCVNLPFCEVKNQLAFHKVRWYKYSFFKSVYSMFLRIVAALQIFFCIFLLKWGTNWRRFWVQRILWSSKILFCFWLEASFFCSNGHIHNVVLTLTKVVKIDIENVNVASTLSNIVQINVEIEDVDSMLFNVVNFNVDVHDVALTLIWHFATSRRHINLKTTLKRRWKLKPESKTEACSIRS